MNKLTRRIFIFLTIILLINRAKAQENLEYPEVGKPMPDLVLKNIKYYSKKQAKISDFRGKWLMLDFWNKYCGACVASFPRNNAMYEKLKDRVQVMLVGIQDPEGQIEPMYAKYKEKERLTMPCAFDSSLASRLDVFSAPYIILIDDKGIVRTITYSISSTQMEGFLSGKPPTLAQAQRMHDETPDNRIPFNEEKPFLINGNGGADTDFVYRTVLARWNGDLQQSSFPGNIHVGTYRGQLQILGAPLMQLYKYAIWGGIEFDNRDTTKYGKISPDVILEIKDSASFKYSFAFKQNKNLFAYSLIMPLEKCTDEALQSAMQHDLENYFGFTASLETRKCPYWKLTASPQAQKKLSTKGGAMFTNFLPKAGFTARNYPFSNVVMWIRGAKGAEFVRDETGITGNVDITMDCIPFNADDLQQALKSNGLELVRDEMEMKVLVIKDKKKAD